MTKIAENKESSDEQKLAIPLFKPPTLKQVSLVGLLTAMQNKATTVKHNYAVKPQVVDMRATNLCCCLFCEPTGQVKPSGLYKTDNRNTIFVLFVEPVITNTNFITQFPFWRLDMKDTKTDAVSWPLQRDNTSEIVFLCCFMS